MKNIKFQSIFLLLTLTASIACQATVPPKSNSNASVGNSSANDVESVQQVERVSSATSDVEKVRDQAIEKLVSTEFNPSDLAEIRYAYKKFDLNNDGFQDAIVDLRGASICGTGGCQIQVLRGKADGYVLLTEISPLQGGFTVLDSRSNGWRDIVVSIGGGGGESGRVLLQFDGKSYPDNPTVLGKSSKADEKLFLSSNAEFEKNSFPVGNNKVSPKTAATASSFLECSPVNLRSGDVLTLLMKAPHGGFLKIVTPQKQIIFLSEEDGDKLVTEAIALGAEPYFSQSQLSKLNELKINTSSATTVDYERGEVAGKLRLRPIFMTSGIYKISLSDSSFEQDDAAIQGSCEVNFRSN